MQERFEQAGTAAKLRRTAHEKVGEGKARYEEEEEVPAPTRGRTS